MRSSARAFPRLGVALVVTLAGCGRNHQRSELYLGETPSTEPPAFIGFEPTRTDEDAGFFGDREIREGPPYNIVVVAARDTAVESPLRIHGMRLHIGDEAHVIHDTSAPPLEAAVKERSGTKPWAATIRLPLGDTLGFVEGQAVSLDATVTLPGSDEEMTLTRAFGAKVNEWSGSKIEGYLSQ